MKRRHSHYHLLMLSLSGILLVSCSPPDQPEVAELVSAPAPAQFAQPSGVESFTALVSGTRVGQMEV